MAQFEAVFQALDSLKEELQRLKKIEQDYYRLKREYEALLKQMNVELRRDILKPEMGFYFYTKTGIYTDQSALSLEEFREVLNKVPLASIEFHNERGDFEKWLDFLKSQKLAKQFRRIRLSKSSGEDLRQKLIQAMNSTAD